VVQVRAVFLAQVAGRDALETVDQLRHRHAEAERTSRGIAVEELAGIRARVRLRKPQRAALHCWSFAQLGEFLTYKARRAGIP